MAALDYSEKELAFLRIVCCSQHEHITQDTVQAQLVEAELMTPDEFKQVKKKLLYSGVIGIVYGNITVEKKEILDLFMDEASI
ncbi:MAG: hypothetical protein NWF07_09905 [Candidatus Bathyarchaeota archaeon]|nr:hypothetical protein [Candidatus Bathyarchaeota archaeon]